MKKLIFLAVSMTALFSCSEDSIMESNAIHESNAIQFGVYTNQTKGVPIDNNTDFFGSGYGFGIYATLHDKSPNPVLYINNEEVRRNGSNWAFDHGFKAYWPTASGTTLDFFAYSPIVDAGRPKPLFSVTEGIKFNEYTVPTIAADQKDFMYAIENDKTSDNNPVVMNFKHALTQVHFKVKTEHSSLFAMLPVNAINLHNIYSQANFKSSLSNATATWETFTSPAVYEVPSLVNNTINNVAQLVSKADDALMLLPQNLESVWPEKAKGAYLTIDYSLYTVLPNNTNYYLHGDGTKHHTLEIPLDLVWQPGKKVTHIITLGKDLNSITFETIVDPWTDQTPETEL